MTQIDTRIKVAIDREATAPATEGFLVSHVPIDQPTTGAGGGSVGWVDLLNSKPVYRCKQHDSIAKEPSSMFLPANQVFRCFQGNASTRALCHGHDAAGFSGNDLSRRRHCAISFKSTIGVIPFPFVVTPEQRPKIRSCIPVTAHDCRPCADVATDPFSGLRLNLRERHGHTDAGVPFAVLAKDLSTLVQFGPRQCQRPVDGPMFASRDIKAAVSAPRGRCAPHHDPTVKASRTSGLLDLGTVDQFGFQMTWDMSGLLRPLKVFMTSAIRTSYKLTQTFRAGEARLLRDCKLIRDIRMQSLEQSSQRRKRVRLILGREELELVPKRYGCHIPIVTEKTPRAKSADFVSAGLSAQNGEPRLRFGSPLVGRVPLGTIAPFKENNVTPDKQLIANRVARKAGHGWATKIVYGPGPARVLSHTRYGYRKKTTGEYVKKAYLRYFGWKNTYYQNAETVVLLPLIFG